LGSLYLILRCAQFKLISDALRFYLRVVLHRCDRTSSSAALHSSTPRTPKISHRERRNGASQILYGFPRSKLNWNKKLWENFATHSIYSTNVEWLFLPGFMKLV
jgi:hypothetical protein